MAVTSRDTRQQPDLTSRFVHEFAVSDADVKACQQLRYKIFAEEMGTQIDGGEDKRDVDHFDAFCHHLIDSAGVATIPPTASNRQRVRQALPIAPRRCARAGTLPLRYVQCSSVRSAARVSASVR